MDFERIVHRFLLAFVACCAVFGSDHALAQEEFFKPEIEVPPTKTPVGGTHVYSFGRFEADFSQLCVDLEKEGRRERLVKIAETRVDAEKECITCRSFWKMIVSACGRLGPKPTPRPTKTPRPRVQKGASSESSEESSSSSEESASSEPAGENTSSGAETPVVATPTQRPPEQRYPSVALLDLASRFSTRVYELDPDNGPTSQMFRALAATVQGQKDLSSAEREYYDIFFSYLLAAWDGRVDSTKLPTPTPEARVLERIFDF